MIGRWWNHPAIAREWTILKGLVEYVRGRSRERVEPGFLTPIDADRIARSLKLDSLGASRGDISLPQTDAFELDSVEQHIVETLDSEWARQRDALLDQLRACHDRLVECSIAPEFKRLQGIATDALAQLDTARARADAELGPLRERHVEIRDELRRFRQRHHLHRPARSAAGRRTTAVLMVLLIAAQSVLTLYLFTDASAPGLPARVGAAIGLSLVTVSLSFVVGLFPARWINHRTRLVKLPGLVLTATALAGLGVLQAFAAHFRDAAAAGGVTHALAEAFRGLTTAPLGLSGIQPLYLLGLGIASSLLALWLGYRRDDPYPGYGRLARRRDDARQAYRDAHAKLFDALERARDRTVDELHDGIRALPAYPQAAARIRAERSALLEQFRQYESSVVSGVNRLLTRYRDTNLEFRSTPPPAYFDKPWTLPRSIESDPEVKALMADGPDIEADADACLARLEDLARSVRAGYESLLESYPRPSMTKRPVRDGKRTRQRPADRAAGTRRRPDDGDDPRGPAGKPGTVKETPAAQ